MTISSYAVTGPNGSFEKYDFEFGELKPDEVEIVVSSCGICHSDLSMKNNDWGRTTYPFVPGHEVIGTVSVIGEAVRHLHIGQTVGLGWCSRSCGICRECISGHSHLCLTSEGTIVGRHGGFAEKVRAQAAWVFPLPVGVDASIAGPLFCGGITVFSPVIIQEVLPTQRVGVVGVGGLGHLAIQFLRAWGCEVTAFSTSSSKEAEVRQMGAHHFVNTKEKGALAQLTNSLDFILVTVNVSLDWDAYFAVLRPRGKLHVVGAVPSLNFATFPLIGGQKSVAASPLGSPSTVFDMLEFCSRHTLKPIVEKFPMSQENEAFEHLKSGKARYSIVLENDFARA
jgi:uncharacterized zinc-type alcohol dehydrogenase-like protein